MSTNTVQLLPLETLTAMAPEELDALCVASVKMEQAAKTSTETHKSSFPAVGKIVCAVEERLNKLVAARLIATNTSLAAYWGSITRAKLNNHALSCAVAFGAFVRTELITEKDYDVCPAQCLELASSISSAVGGNVGHEIMPKVAAQLKERGKDAAKNLRNLLATVKEAKGITPEKALQMCKDLFADGHLLAVLHACVAEIAYIEKDDAMRLKEAFMVLNLGLDRAGSPEQQEAWLTEKAQGQSKPKLVTAEA